ncbi:hypothetical protein BTM329_13060 [Helicobacter pylori]
MAKVEVELKKLHKILADDEYFYQVPDYQRPYVWDKDHLGALIDDLVAATQTIKKMSIFAALL